MNSESQSLDSQIVGIEETVGLMIPRPVVEPEQRARLLKIRQMNVDAGRMAPLEQPPKPESPTEDSK